MTTELTPVDLVVAVTHHPLPPSPTRTMEKVHFQLESTLPELRDLEEKGLFTRAELRQVTLKRTKHESNLVKRAGKPEDYLAYAEYEIGLERLRRMRWKRLSESRIPLEETTAGSLITIWTYPDPSPFPLSCI